MHRDSTTNLKLRVFISSVQEELKEERMELRILFSFDPFLLRFTVPKLFEKLNRQESSDEIPESSDFHIAVPLGNRKHQTSDNHPTFSLESSDRCRTLVPLSRFYKSLSLETGEALSTRLKQLGV